MLAGCAVYPKTVYDPDDQRCDLSSRKMRLEGATFQTQCTAGGAGCILGGVFIVAASTLVSGSIVVVGNTVHWLEKQGKCDDSYLNQKIFQHNTPLLEQEGEIIDDSPIKAEPDTNSDALTPNKNRPSKRY